ncbi:MAG TPA: reverse gyrase, partial [Armatimonadetes bacterium]|nr:reverse gyrase [Armatimonadota bacterium]
EVAVEEVERNPPPPFTTDEMLRAAAAEMKLPAGKIMALAQDLFELGLITYHRTDSTRVSTRGMEVAREYIVDRFGDETLFRPRAWEITGPGIQAAHECIRPTRSIDVRTLSRLVRTGVYRFPRRLTPAHYKLYDLIFRRFVASQMDSAVIRVQKVRLTNSAAAESIELEVPFEVVKEGFTKVLAVRVRPRVEPGTYSVLSVRKRTVPAVYLYREGDLVAEMKRRRIGRPSTYARIIDTLKEEGYVREYGGRLVPTKLGIEVYEYLSERFGRMVSEELTRDLEELTDRVRSGEVDYLDALRSIREQVAALPEAV